MSFTPEQREALVTAGGCAHTLNPFRACDTCGRPAIGGRSDRATAWNFVAETVDGVVLEKRDVLSVSNLPLDAVARLTVQTDDPRIPRVSITVDPRRGERLFQFSRVAVKTGVEGRATRELVILVFEVRREDDPPDRFVRLYLHPLQGPILSTENLYF